MRKPSRGVIHSERGTVKALVDRNLQAISCVARDDRDGRSRYRAAKMSPVPGIIRVVPRVFSPRPYFRGEVYFLQCKLLWR